MIRSITSFGTFQQFNAFNRFTVLFELYKPYINYSWSQTLTVGGNQQIKDTGTAGLNLQQFFGQGCWFNGVDMQISIPVNATIQTEIKRVNGVAGINTNTQVLTNYNVYSGSGAKVYKDLYMFNRLLTQAEIEKYNNQPNQFFVDSLEDSSCVLAMPMCEKDGFVRNYKNYSEGSNLIVDSNFENPTLWVIGDSTKISISGNAVNFNNSSSFMYPTPSLAIFNTPITINKCFMVEFEVFNYQSGSVRLEIGASVANNNATPFLTSNGKYQFIVQHTTNSAYRPIFRAINFIGSITNLRVKELTSIYPITNYLATCRTNAQRLSYGLQTSCFKRDSNGLILSKSNFLEADGVGYGNTGWVPKWNEDFTVESVFEVSNDSEFRLNGNNYADGIYFGKNSVGKSLYVRVFGAPVILLANSKDIVCLIFSYNWQTKKVKQYVDGVLVTTQLATKTTNSSLPVLLGMIALGGSNYPVIKPLRLFKTHSKVLTQEEVTKNFNKYQAQGLLSESGLLFPDNALVDESGNFILDENNNFIIAE